MALYLLFRLAGLVLPLLPERLSYNLATLAGDLGYLVYWRGRRAVTDNLTHVLGPRTPRSRLRRIVREVFRTAARNYVDLFRLPHVDLETLNRRVLWQGLSHVEEALARGQGVVIAGAHLGSFDILSQLSAHRGTPMAILVEPLRNPRVFRLVAALRSSLGLTMLPATPGGIRAAIRLLQAGGAVGMACDRDIQRHGLPVEFFDAETTVPTGAVDLALRTGAALVPCFGLRLGFRRYAICFEPALDLPQRPHAGREDVVVHDAVAEITQTIEGYVAKYAGQWVVFEHLWRNRAPLAPVRLRQEARADEGR